MAFFLIDRDSSDGSLALLATSGFSTREDALAALPGLVGAGQKEGHDVFVCDLDAATPVLFVPQPAPVADAAVETAPAEETTAEVDAPEAEESSASDVGVWEAPVEEPAEAGEPESAEGGLAEALRRAATSLESEGIITPESIPPMAVEPADEGDADVEMIDAEEVAAAETADEIDSGDEDTDEIAEVIASLGVAEPMSAAETGSDEEQPEAEEAPEEGTGDWPWANVEQVTEVAEEPAQGEASEPEEVPVPEDVATDDESLIAANPEAADFTPRPVIMGDYGDEAVPQEEAGDEVESEPATDEDAAEDVAEEEPAEAVADETPFVEEPVAAYEPGELSLNEYTCDDCVYANTCPKAGSSSPAECGSFQWKSV